jgi:hypothetical protein
MEGGTPRRTIAVDFDATLSSYLKRRTKAEQTLFEDAYDFPLPGALEWVRQLVTVYRVVVFTCRANEPGGKEAVEAWLTRWGFPALEVTGEKPVAHLYVDDNALCFTGSNYPSLEAIAAHRSWIWDLRRVYGTDVG